MLLTVILILSVALLFATLPRLYRPRRTITKARPETLEWKVGPDQKDFLLVNNRAFYGTIDGFEYEEGYVYRLKVKEYDLGSKRTHTWVQYTVSVPYTTPTYGRQMC